MIDFFDEFVPANPGCPLSDFIVVVVVVVVVIVVVAFTMCFLCCCIVSLLKPCPHCRRKVRLSHKSETVAENGDSRRFLRQSHFCFVRQSHFSATMWTGL